LNTVLLTPVMVYMIGPQLFDTGTFSLVFATSECWGIENIYLEGPTRSVNPVTGVLVA